MQSSIDGLAVDSEGRTIADRCQPTTDKGLVRISASHYLLNDRFFVGKLSLFQFGVDLFVVLEHLETAITERS